MVREESSRSRIRDAFGILRGYVGDRARVAPGRGADALDHAAAGCGTLANIGVRLAKGRHTVAGVALAAFLGALPLLAAPALSAPGTGDPVGGLTPEEQARFEFGAAIFAKQHGPEDGLGPLYNGRACADCHAYPAAGGTDRTRDHLITRIGRERDAYDDLVELGGPVLARRSVRDVLPSCGLKSGEDTPKQATAVSKRQPPTLYGAGLIAAIPDDTLHALAASQQGHPDGIAGRVNHVDGGIGRFGQKAQFATLERFVADAMRNELGITNPHFPDEKPTVRDVPDGCDLRADVEDDGTALNALVDFVSMLAPPSRGPRSPAELRGRAVFEEVGCVACHTPSLRTGAHQIAALSDQEAQLYSDLLLHDMGEYVADGVRQGEAGGSDWRTPPLWGLGQRVWFLHDARATDLRTVIELHNGEAKASRDRLFTRPRNDLQDLLSFLRSL